jgi:hypothetical protein
MQAGGPKEVGSMEETLDFSLFVFQDPKKVMSLLCRLIGQQKTCKGSAQDPLMIEEELHNISVCSIATPNRHCTD